MKEAKSPEELKKLLESNDQIVVFYFLSTCPHCQVMHKPFEEIEKEEKGKAKFIKVEAENIPDDMGKTSFPDFELREKKKVKKSTSGEMTKEELRDKLFGTSGGRRVRNRRTRTRRLARRTRKVFH